MSNDPLFITIVIVLGAALGSFFNVIIHRLPKKESIVFPSSHCPSCGRAIPPWFNIPILSYLILGGKCYYCKSKIHWHYLLVEIITPIVFVLLYFTLIPIHWFVFLKYVIFFGFGISIFFIDLFHQIIPDRLSLPLILLGLGIAFLPWTDINWKSSLLGGGLCFLFFYGISYVYYLLKKNEGMGGGDIKLITGVGFFYGMPDSLFIIILSSFLAVITVLVFQRNRKQPFPFGPFIIAACLLYTLFGYQIVTWYMSLLNAL